MCSVIQSNIGEHSRIFETILPSTQRTESSFIHLTRLDDTWWDSWLDHARLPPLQETRSQPVLKHSDWYHFYSFRYLLSLPRSLNKYGLLFWSSHCWIRLPREVTHMHHSLEYGGPHTSINRATRLTDGRAIICLIKRTRRNVCIDVTSRAENYSRYVIIILQLFPLSYRHISVARGYKIPRMTRFSCLSNVL